MLFIQAIKQRSAKIYIVEGSVPGVMLAAIIITNKKRENLQIHYLNSQKESNYNNQLNVNINTKKYIKNDKLKYNIKLRKKQVYN